MTTVHISLGRDDGTDQTAAKGVVEWEPTTRREDGTMVILERGFTVPLVDGEATVVVDPSGLTWCWRVTERTDSGGTVRYVSVPDSAAVVEYVDLPDVDPTTLVAWTPADPEAAYLASLGTAVDDYLTANPVSAPVDSVNGQTGAVALDAADVGADPAGTAAGLVGALAIPDSPDDIGAASAAHTHAPEDVTGTAVITTDARLSDARTPLAHSHTLADVTDAGDAAGLDVGTTAGTVMAGDDSRVTSLPSTYQPLDSDLTALAELSSTGILVRTGDGSAAVRSVIAGSGVAVTNGDGVSGNPTIATSGVPVLLATYTHTTNVERQPTAVDVTADTITIAAHGFTANAEVYPVGNVASQIDYPQKVLPGGLSMGDRYYVLVVDADTIQLSATSGGAAIDLTTKATADTSAWHLEPSSGSLLEITGIGTLTRARLRIIGRQLRTITGISYIYLPGHVADTAWRRIASGTNAPRSSGVSQRLHFDLTPNVWGEQEVVIDAAGPVVNLRGRAVGLLAATDSANTTRDYTYVYSLASAAIPFTSIKLHSWYPANGFTVEVWSY